VKELTHDAQQPPEQVLLEQVGLPAPPLSVLLNSVVTALVLPESVKGYVRR
jgi:hypothetical protein